MRHDHAYATTPPVPESAECNAAPARRLPVYRTRADCLASPAQDRPCLRFLCTHNLVAFYAASNRRSRGREAIQHGLDTGDFSLLPATSRSLCMLDVIDREGPMSDEQIAAVLGLSVRRATQLRQRALRNAETALRNLGLLEELSEDHRPQRRVPAQAADGCGCLAVEDGRVCGAVRHCIVNSRGKFKRPEFDVFCSLHRAEARRLRMNARWRGCSIHAIADAVQQRGTQAESALEEERRREAR